MIIVLSTLRTPILGASALVSFLLLFPVLGLAQSSELESLRATVKGMEQQMQKALERIDQLEKEKLPTSARVGRSGKIGPGVKARRRLLNPSYRHGVGCHRPQKSTEGGNFNFRAAEFGSAASVDPFARGYSFITGSNEGVEVEEAAAITSSLPWNLTAKGGDFLPTSAVC